jgi:hypothetical protein
MGSDCDHIATMRHVTVGDRCRIRIDDVAVDQDQWGREGTSGAGGDGGDGVPERRALHVGWLPRSGGG